MSECTICVQSKELVTCPICKQMYCKIHYDFHLGFSKACAKEIERIEKETQ